MVWYYTIKRTHSGTNNKNSLVALKKLCKKFFLKCSVQPFHCFAGKSFFAIPQKRTWKLLLSWSGRYWLLIKRVDTGILPRWCFKHCEVAIFVQFSMETVKKKKKSNNEELPCLSNFGSRRLQILEDLRALQRRRGTLSPTGVRVDVLDDVKADSHGRHGYCSSRP